MWLMTPTQTRPHKPMLAEWTSEILSLSLALSYQRHSAASSSVHLSGSESRSHMVPCMVWCGTWTSGLSAIALQPFSTWLMTPIRTCSHKPMLAEWANEHVFLPAFEHEVWSPLETTEFYRIQLTAVLTNSFQILRIAVSAHFCLICPCSNTQVIV